MLDWLQKFLGIQRLDARSPVGRHFLIVVPYSCYLKDSFILRQFMKGALVGFTAKVEGVVQEKIFWGSAPDPILFRPSNKKILAAPLARRKTRSCRRRRRCRRCRRYQRRRRKSRRCRRCRRISRRKSRRCRRKSRSDRRKSRRCRRCRRKSRRKSRRCRRCRRKSRSDRRKSRRCHNFS